MMSVMNKYSRRIVAAFLVLVLGTSSGCSNAGSGNNSTAESAKTSPYWTVDDGYIRAAEHIDTGMGNYVSNTTEVENSGNSDEGGNGSDDVSLEAAQINSEYTLSVPTYVDKLGDNWFIVDCYHDQIIYNDNMTDPLNEWNVLTKDVSQPHTMASDGEVYLVDDTENHRVLVFEEKDGMLYNTQLFNEIGQRPHYTVYDEDEKAFYVWSSTTGEMYIFRHEEGSTDMYLVEIRRVGGTAAFGKEAVAKTKSGTESESAEKSISISANDSILNGTYIRSFYIDGDDIYFVSGITAEGQPSGIICCNKYTLEVKTSYNVPGELSGMAAMRYDAPYYYITVSTDVTGNQDAATMIRTKDLKGLESGGYEDIYSTYFEGGGTPYNMFEADGIHYLTEHRLPAHSIWSYELDDNGEIINVTGVY